MAIVGEMCVIIKPEKSWVLCNDYSPNASNVGIGAYLYQERDARKHPIRFMSKALAKVERRWDTVEKEAYAIFYALKKLKYLLHDKSFTIRTDNIKMSH